MVGVEFSSASESLHRMQYIYIHCYAHTLNLVLVDCAKVVQSVREFFCLLEQLYVFVSTTKAHVIFMAKQNELLLDDRDLLLPLP